MRWNFKKVFLSVGMNILFGVDGNFLVGINTDQHLSDVRLQKKSFRLLFTELWRPRDNEIGSMTSHTFTAVSILKGFFSSYVNDVFFESLFEVLDEDFLVFVLFQKHRVGHAGLLPFVENPLHNRKFISQVTNTPSENTEEKI